MSMVQDVMTLVRMMYRLILNQDCDQMELNSHLLLLGHVHPDNNYGFDTTEMMTMINMARYVLQDQLRENDALR